MISLGKKKKKRGTRRSTIRRPATKRDIFMVWLRRSGGILAVIVIVVWAAAWVWLSGAAIRAQEFAHESFLSASADLGFSVENILVEGRVNTEADTLMAALGVEQGGPIFAFDIEKSRKRLEDVSWVKAVQLERRLPDTIFLGLVERTPVALWQSQKRLYLIDDEGVVLTDKGLGAFGDFLMVVGEGAPQNAKTLVETLNAEPDLRSKIEVASWVGGRRWNLTSVDGVTVKLPETDIGLALRRLANEQEQSAILDKNLDHIDLRNTDRIIVQAAPGKVQDYNPEGQSQDAAFKPDNNI